MNDRTYQDILLSPEKVVPSLSEKEIRTILVETILEYLNGSVELDVIIKITKDIEKHTKTDLSAESLDILAHLTSLSNYTNQEVRYKNTINSIISDVLNIIACK